MTCGAGHEDMLSEDGIVEDDNSKHVSSTFRGVYKRRFDTKWRAEITAGLYLTTICPRPFQQRLCLYKGLRQRSPTIHLAYGYIDHINQVRDDNRLENLQAYVWPNFTTATLPCLAQHTAIGLAQSQVGGSTLVAMGFRVERQPLYRACL